MARRSLVWNLADKLSTQEARCNVCSKVIKYCGTSTNIWRHIQKCHPTAVAQLGKELTQPTDDESESPHENEKPLPAKKRNNKNSQVAKRHRTTATSNQRANGEEVLHLPNPVYEDYEIRIDDHKSYGIQEQQSTLLDQACRFSSYSQALQIPAYESICQVENQTYNPMIRFKKYKSKKKRGDDMDTKITAALVHLVVKNGLPISIVNTDAFEYFMSVVCPHYQIPCASTMINTIDQKYEALFETEKEKLTSVKNFSLNIHTWTENHSVSQVLAVTAHYIDDEAHRKYTVLGSMEMIERHSAEVIAEYIRQTLNKWSIESDQITVITTENEANIVDAVNSLVGEGRHINCFAHTLDSILSTAFKEEQINAIVESIENIITWFNCLDASELREVEDLCLLQSCPSKWNSTCHKLNRFMELKTTISDILLAHSNAPHLIGEDSVAVIEDILPILELFDNMTKDCSKEAASVSRIIPITDFMSTKLNAIEATTEIGKSFLSTVLEDFNERFADLESNYILSVSTLLDPRYKRVHFKDNFKCSRAISRLINFLKTPLNTDGTNERMSLSVEDYSQFSELDSFTANKSQSTAIYKPGDINAYLKSPTVNVTMDPLQYWQINRREYPQLYEIMKQFLCAQGSSVPCERLSSIANFIMNARHNRVPKDMLEKLLFLMNLSHDQWEF